MDKEAQEPALLQVVTLSRGGGQFSGRLDNPTTQYEAEFEFDPLTKLSRVTLLPEPGRYVRPSVPIAPVKRGDRFVLSNYPDLQDPTEKHLYRRLAPADGEGPALYLAPLNFVRLPIGGGRLIFADARGTTLTMFVLTQGAHDIAVELLESSNS